MPYIKSYSNYVLRTKHQNSNRGTIYERDITTIGGRDQFAKGQTPIYKSGNFVITVNNGKEFYKKVNPSEWYRNKISDVWTTDELSLYNKDEKSSYDKKIEIKKDFYDIRDFAYYGSCAELIRGSINGIIKDFPGELFTPKVGGGLSYVYEETAEMIMDDDTTSSVTYERRVDFPCDVNKESAVTEIEEDGGEWVAISFGVPATYVSGGEIKEFTTDTGEPEQLVLVDNPFNINIYSKYVPNGADPKKYFADGGIENYVAYFKDENGEWDYLRPWNVRIEENGIKDDVEICPGNYLGYVTFSFYRHDDDFNVTEFIKFDSGSSEYADAIQKIDNDGVEVFDELNVIDVRNGHDLSGDCQLTIYVFVGANKEIVYAVDPMYNGTDENGCLTVDKCSPFNIRIRPNKGVVSDYFDSLDHFQRTLLNRLSNPIYTASFELIGEDENGYFTYIDTFTFPTTYGEYNLGTFGSAFDAYVEKLTNISEFYDERFTDNLWRSMTHESIKNFDWTIDEDGEYTNGANKVQKLIHVWAREFDEIKGYIDAINSYNVVTYDNSNNLPDYFFSDKLEDDGWDIKPIYPFILNEYKDTFDIEFDWENIDGADIELSEKSNRIVDSEGNPIFEDGGYIKRSFTQIIDENEELSSLGSKFRPYSGKDKELENEDDCENVYKSYSDETVYSVVDANNEFMKRFLINSKYILRKKGTIDGIESMMSLFGLKSKRYVFENSRYFKISDDNISFTNKGTEYYGSQESVTYDYDVKEYTLFTNRIRDPWNEAKKMNEIDWVNSTKLISYHNEDFLNGIYTPYQGLMVAYRNGDDKDRYIYPKFTAGGEYDGNPYYQMNGGWLSKTPFMFDVNNNILVADTEMETDTMRDDILFTETIRDIHTVQTLEDLLSTPSLAEHGGDICQVIDLGGRYAIVDGILYNLYTEIPENEENALYEGFSYFYGNIENGALTLGNCYFDDFVVITNPYMPNGKQKINLSDEYYQNRSIKIYVLKKDDGTYTTDVHSANQSISTFTVFENGQYMKGDNFTNYFRINDVERYNELSVFGWQQLREDDYDYYRLNSIFDYNNGNNPHTGHMMYDNGHEYLTYFKNIFKHAYNNDLFDYRYFVNDDDIDILDRYSESGFTNLIREDICDNNYDEFLIEDTKVHYFGDLLSKKYVLDKSESEDAEYNLTDISTKDIIFSDTFKISGQTYGEGLEDVDGVTNQIVNIKRMDIDFYLRNTEKYSREWLEEVKYLDSVVMSYVSQMIPSNTICRVNYITKEGK